MGNWYQGDICEEHDSPDECDESCGMDIEDEGDEPCRLHLFSGVCDDTCERDKEDNDPETDHILSMMAESYSTGMIRS